VLTVHAGLLARESGRVEDVQLLRPAFPGFPSDRRQFPRLQLRGSAGFSPASLPHHGDKDARTKYVVKEPKVATALYWLKALEVNARAARPLLTAQGVNLLHLTRRRLSPQASKSRLILVTLAA
jgi:hypothetical protein